MNRDFENFTMFPGRPRTTFLTLRANMHVFEHMFDYKAIFSTAVPRSVIKKLRSFFSKGFTANVVNINFSIQS